MSENFIPKHGHLTEEDIRQYVQDEMPRADVRRVDAHLEECPLCSDAIEGAMTLQAADFEQVMASLENKIEAKYIPQPYQIHAVKRFSVWRWASAAAILVASGVGLWFFSQSNPSVNEPSQAVVVAPTVPIPTEIQTPQPTISTPILEKKEAVLAEATVPNINIVQPISKENEKKISPKKIEKNTAINTIEKNKEVASVVDKVDKNMGVRTETPVGQPNLASATPRFNVGTQSPSYQSFDRSAALDIPSFDFPTPRDFSFSIDLTKQPTIDNNKYWVNSSNDSEHGLSENQVLSRAMERHLEERMQIETTFYSTDSLMYRSGLTNFKKGQFWAATQQFEAVAKKQKKGNLYEQSLWYAANSYLKLQNKKEAKALFERIVTEGGNFKAAAEEALSKEF